MLSSAKSDSFLLWDFLSLDESDSLNDESDYDGSDSGSAGTCAFPVCFEDSVGCVDDSVGHVYGVYSSIFVPILIESNCDVIPLVVFAPIRVESKGGLLIEIFWCPKS